MGINGLLYKWLHWEQWHYHRKYIPLYPAWMLLCLRARSLWFFSTSNPSIPFGGFEGEGKEEIYAQLPAGTYPKSVWIEPEEDGGHAFDKIRRGGISFPLIAKPDVGMMGLMCRKLDSEDNWHCYHAAMTVTYIVQEWVAYPLEVSIFYYRMPGAEKGTITGFVKKEGLELTGDGSRTIEALMDDLIGRPGFDAAEWKIKHQHNLLKVLAKGEVYTLAWVANLSRGGRLVSLAAHIDDDLLRVIDSLSHYNNAFYYGRYDIKCRSVEELKQGKAFSILEFNGCGAEPHHIYGNNNNLLQAYRIILHHWNVLYIISRINRKRGVPLWSFKKGLQYLRKAKLHFRKLKELDRRFGEGTTEPQNISGAQKAA